MQISSLSSRRADNAPAAKADVEVAAEPPARAAGAASSAPLAATLQAMPEIDQAKVDAVRAALARGEVRFDPQRLAGLIEQYHGGR
ncbi:flagellar biosynthesis anti-sigma factor FlgM [Chromobacterium sphagni]|uniref:Negative regulator of flagellin synthesis n=1 Tax=Chromobacterium sphagni TaxID=1903179 RepID=A0A1S1WW20_9NEIS|nr:flagellar biosynthesis anti-sigma factor FlgM [Chromobacterium sphagni]OHX11461.1 flagellar biosynthesis anti-sigma factor FlgM [Chromobacterium sphagni]OHX20921.1 flagellar biosynthesis anti-sigma factor FlgM [Chromobacterium sphagni]